MVEKHEIARGGRYLVVDHRGRLIGVVVAERVDVVWSAYAFHFRWLGQSQVWEVGGQAIGKEILLKPCHF